MTVCQLVSCRDSKYICDRLAEQFCVTIVSPDKISTIGSGSQVLIVITGSIIPAENSIAIIDNASCSLEGFFGSIILSEENRDQLARLNGEQQVLVCGMASTSTLTCSSVQRDMAVVALQRQIIRPDGGATLPCERCLELPESGELFPMLATAGVIALLSR